MWTQISNYVSLLFLPKIPDVHSILVNDNMIGYDHPFAATFFKLPYVLGCTGQAVGDDVQPGTYQELVYIGSLATVPSACFLF